MVAERPAGKLVQQSSPFEPKQVELAHYKTYGRVIQHQSKIEGCDVSAHVPKSWFNLSPGFPKKIVMVVGAEKAGGMGEEIRNWRG